MCLVVAIAATAALQATTVTACGQNTAATSAAPAGTEGASSAPAAEKGTIGVAMPTKTSERWIKDNDYLKKTLEEAGYNFTSPTFRNDDIPTQVTQLIRHGHQEEPGAGHRGHRRRRPQGLRAGRCQGEQHPG